MGCNKTKIGGGGLLAGLAAMPLALAGGWLAYSKFFIDHDVPLRDAIPAQRVVYAAKTAVNLSYYVDKGGNGANGRPLVLIHSINAAASAYEMGPLFAHYQGQRPVYALDLPGYGFSDRPDRVYSAQYFAESILDFLETQVNEPADVVALSLSCEFVARAASAKPELFNSVSFISPTGFTRQDQSRSSQRAAAENKSGQAYSLLANPLWGQALYDLIVTRPSLHFFLNKSFVEDITPGMVGYAYETSHQAGAKNVPLYFVSGALFTKDVRTRYYTKIKTPGLVIYDRDGFSRFDTLLDLLQNYTNWSAARITPSLGLPQFERLAETAVALDTFWSKI